MTVGSVQDARGLQFVDAAAFCAFHCRETHLAAPSECSAARCPHFQRRLESNGSVDGYDVPEIDFLACRGVDTAGSEEATKLTLAVNQGATVSDVLTRFHDAFFAAFDAMVASENATADACQLQLLQDVLLPTVNDSDAETARQPMLVKLSSTLDDERACVQSIKEIWSDDDEPLTPFLTRRGQRNAAATVMLLHVDGSVAASIHALDCVDSVLELPAVLKLLPFARSTAQLSVITAGATDEFPSMEIRLIDGSDPAVVLQRLQSTIQQWFGISNAFELPEAFDHRPLSIFLKPLQELTTWSRAVALAVSDATVEWMDVRVEVSANVLRGEPTLPMSRRLDEYVPSLVGVDSARSAGIRGNDVIVGVTDSGLYLNHDQFDQSTRAIFTSADMSARKVVYYNAWANDVDESDSVTCGHGTHVTGILAGSSWSGTSDDLGIADNARIAFMDIGAQSSSCAGKSGCGVQLATPAKAGDLVESQMGVGARIFSFSWGTPGSDYSSQARDLDDFIYQNPDVLVVVAAGNSGESATTGTISSPSGAKNVISVGASLNAAASFSDVGCSSVFNEYSVASFSSSGPTTDGRLKPDVVAPGMRLVSSQSEKPGSTTKTSATCSLQGTSQATPVVTGMAVLLFEWLRDGWWKDGTKNSEYGMETVPAALLKALIIHSGEPLRRRLGPLGTGFVSCGQVEKEASTLTTFPNVFQGYGKPNMSNLVEFGAANGSSPSLYFLPNSTAGSEPRVAHNQEVIISFTVASGVDLRTTLVWTDPPGSVRSTTQLQHDLDLSVRLRNGSTSFYPVTADKTSRRDDTNNVEVVLVSYADLLAAATADNSSASAVGDAGELIVEAVIFGRSVLLADAQTFAFVASSSSIGSASGFADTTSESQGPWRVWMLAVVIGAALLLLICIAGCVRCYVKRKEKKKERRRRQQRAATPGTAAGHQVAGYPGAIAPYNQFLTPPAALVDVTAMGGDVAGERCPFCMFTCADPVVMVNHVEHLHSNALPSSATAGDGVSAASVPVLEDGGLIMSGECTMPPVERCPHCSFTTPDAVILVNHVEHVHRA